MAHVKYTGRDDLRVLAANDLKKAGVEGFRSTEFAQGVAIEVDAEVAKALLDEENEAIFGKFEDAGADVKAADKVAKAEAKAAKNEAAPDEKSAGGE